MNSLHSHSVVSLFYVSPSVRESRFWNPGNLHSWNLESGNILLMESGILGFGIRNTAQGIWNPTNYWNSESKFYWQIPESGTWNPESTVRNPESKTVLDSLPWGNMCLPTENLTSPSPSPLSLTLPLVPLSTVQLPKKQTSSEGSNWKFFNFPNNYLINDNNKQTMSTCFQNIWS